MCTPLLCFSHLLYLLLSLVTCTSLLCFLRYRTSLTPVALAVLQEEVQDAVWRDGPAGGLAGRGRAPCGGQAEGEGARQGQLEGFVLPPTTLNIIVAHVYSTHYACLSGWSFVIGFSPTFRCPGDLKVSHVAHFRWQCSIKSFSSIK